MDRLVFMINKIMKICVQGKRLIAMIIRYQQLQNYQIKYFAKAYKTLFLNSVLI